MDKTELRNLRIRIKFDMRSMALCCGCPLSTYARYEDGTAAVPASIERAALETAQISDTFMAGLADRVDAAVGNAVIYSEPPGDGWEHPDSLQK